LIPLKLEHVEINLCMPEKTYLCTVFFVFAACLVEESFDYISKLEMKDGKSKFTQKYMI
jgi:hypothetical protein